MKKTQIKKNLIFNEVYTPTFEKKKLIKPYERSVLQIQLILAKKGKGVLKKLNLMKKLTQPRKNKYLYCVM